MATKTKKMNIIKQVLIGHRNGRSVRELADMYSMSPTTVQRYIALARADSMGIDELVRLDDPELDLRFNEGRPASHDWRYEDFTARLPYFRRELARKGVTVQMLWEEYREKVPDGYGITQFRYHLGQDVMMTSPSTVMKMFRKPGEEMEVDFAGKKLSYVDLETGEIVRPETFVAILPYSGYTFVMCVPSQRSEDFLRAIDTALWFFGGAPKTLVTDNLRAAVKKVGRLSEVTDALMDLATHYGCDVRRTRAYKPRDKAPVEDAVNKVYMRIYSRLRNRVFHSIEELNAALLEQLADYNSRKFQGYDFSRREKFLTSEKPELLPLPPTHYETKEYTTLTVSKFGDIILGKERHRYSVPCQLTGRKVLVKSTATQVRVFYKRECVATHERSFEPGGQTYVDEHLFPNTRAVYECSPQHFIDKAAQYGPETTQVIQNVFSSGSPSFNQYDHAKSILSLARTADRDVFHMACRTAIEYRQCNYRFILNMVNTRCEGYLEQNGDHLSPDAFSPASHTNIRGPQAFQ